MTPQKPTILIIIFMTLVLFTVDVAFAGTAKETDVVIAKKALDQGVEADRQGKHDMAIAQFNKAIEINPQFAEAYYSRGIAYLSMGNRYQAISDFTKVIEINPNIAEAYYHRAVAYVIENNSYGQVWKNVNPTEDYYDQALKDVNKAESLGYKVNPDFLNRLRKASGKDLLQSQ